MPPDELSQHPDLAATGASMRAAWREEQEAATRDAHRDWEHRLTLVDRLRAHMHRGDVVRVTVAGHQLAGPLEEVGADLVALRTPSGRVDVQLAPCIPLLFEVVEVPATHGHRGTDVAGGRFRHALIVREDDHIRLGTLDAPDGLDGTITVGSDHVVLRGDSGATRVYALTAVAWIAAAPG
jgi:hypothetical protein